MLKEISSRFLYEVNKDEVGLVATHGYWPCCVTQVKLGTAMIMCNQDFFKENVLVEIESRWIL